MLSQGKPGNEARADFVPGFDNGHAEAVYRFAQLVHHARINAAQVPFSWPSRGNVLDYVYDRESTIYSRFGLDAVLKAAVDSPTSPRW